jgi:heme exporter protein D
MVSPILVTTLLDAGLWLALLVTALAVVDAALHDVRMSRAMALEERRYYERRTRVDP